MFYSSYIEISRSALVNNLTFIKEQLKPGTLFSSVIKGNAYGHGIEEFGRLAFDCGVRHFSVFSADEAYRLQQALPEPATIMLMGYIDDSELEWAVAHDIEFYVFSLSRLQQAANAAHTLQKPARIHLDLETGMNRIGLGGDEIGKAVSFIKANRQLFKVMGACTHFAGAESQENDARVTKQFHNYQQTLTKIRTGGIEPRLLHTACSAAVMAYPQSHLDLVRVGIMQYGFWSSPETFQRYMKQSGSEHDPLRRLINWKSHIMSLKEVQQGDYIGYGQSYKADREMVIAAIPVGYAWGYSRTLSNQGEVLIRGQRVRVVGIVNMNVLMVDVTDISDVALKDEVVLLGNQGGESITVASFSELTTQLNYELLTRLPMNIPRYIID